MSKEDRDAKRNETINKAMEIMQKGVEEYLDSEKFKELLDNLSKFHQYSTNNILLVLGQNPSATQLAGYNKWRSDFNRQVKRGEKGLMIWMPVEVKVKEEQYARDSDGHRIVDENGEFIKEKVETKKKTFKITYTFDISQTEQIEGKPVIELSPTHELEGDVNHFENLKNAIISISPARIDFESYSGDSKGYYDSVINKIVVQKGMSEQQTLKTMIHEVAHSVVHNSDNLKKLKNEENVDLSRNDMEVQAESIAYIVCKHLGIDTSEYSFPYVATWKDRLPVDGIDTITKNLKYIKETSFSLTKQLDTYFEQMEIQKEKEASNIDKVLFDIEWSENGLLKKYSEEANVDPSEMLSFSEVNSLMKRMNAYCNERNEGYYKTSYEITVPALDGGDPYSYSGRYDIGSEQGDIIQSIESFLDWNIQNENDNNALAFKNNFIPVLKQNKELSLDEAKRVDDLYRNFEMKEVEHQTNSLIHVHFDSLYAAKYIMRIDEKVDDLFDRGEISRSVQDRINDNLDVFEDALNERIKYEIENNTIFKMNLEHAVAADGSDGFRRAIYNQDDMYKDSFKSILGIDDLTQTDIQIEI